MKLRVLFFILFVCQIGFSQVLLNPCANVPGCQASVRNGVVHSSFTVLTANQKYNLLVGAGDTLTQQIDSTFSGTVNLKLISGPGTFVGPSNKSFSKYAYMDMKFFTAGDYELEIEIVGVAKDTMSFAVVVDDFTKMCNEFPKGCVSGGGTKIYSSGPNVIVVDVMFPFNVLVLNPDGKIDNTYAGVVTLTKLSGNGELKGNLSLYGEKRISFNDLIFDQIGNYKVKVDVENVGSDTVSFEVVLSNGVSELNVKRINIYPNPSQNYVSIENSGDNLFVKQIDVLNVLGERVKSISLNRVIQNAEIVPLDLESLPSGTYYTVIQGIETNITSSVVLIK